MKNRIGRILTLLLAAILLLSGVSCAKSGKESGVPANETPAPTEQPKADLFDRSLSIKVEHTYKEGDTHYLYALFPDGQTGFYLPLQPGLLPELRDLNTGKVTKITLSDCLKEDVEAMFRSAVVLFAKRNGADTSAIEERVSSLNGLEIFKAYPNPLVMRCPLYSLTSAKTDLLCVQDYNTGAGGMIDPKTGVLYNNFRTENGSFEAVSAHGTKILFATRPLGGAILNLTDLSLQPIAVSEMGRFQPKDGTAYCSFTALTYLGDGSIAAIVSEQSFAGKERTEQDWLFIIREDGGSEQYDLGTDLVSGNYRIVSADPNCVLAVPAIAGLTLPRLVNRASGEVAALKISGFELVSVPLSEAGKGNGGDGAISVIDVLNDGRTLIVRDWNTGALALFRPDTMQTKVLRILDEEVYLCMDFCGDHRGKLCTVYNPRGGETERGLLLTIVDDNGNPVFE